MIPKIMDNIRISNYFKFKFQIRFETKYNIDGKCSILFLSKHIVNPDLLSYFTPCSPQDLWF